MPETAEVYRADLCDKLIKRLGLTREQWTELAARPMRAETPEPGDPTEH